MKFTIIAGNNYAAASKSITEILKQTDQCDLSVNHIVISNDRCSMSSELEILDALGGSFNTSVLTFARLTSRIMKERQFISKQSAIMLINKLAGELKDDFLCFKTSYDTAGFAQNIYDTISQLKYSAITPDKIDINSFGQNLKLKMHDVKLLYAAYEDFIKDRYVDSGAKLQELIKHIPASPLIKNSYFYVKDFDAFSAQEILIIRELVIYSKGVTVALPFVKGKRIYSDDSFNSMLNVASGLDITADVQFVVDNQPNFVSHIEDNLFAYKTAFVKKPVGEELCVVKESNVFAEAESAAKYICHKVAQGDRYKDFLVVAGDVDRYSYAIEQVFDKYHIRYFLDKKVSLAEHPLAKFILSLFRCKITNFRREECIAAMKNYFYSTDGDVCGFENYCLKNNLKFFAVPFEVFDEQGKTAEKQRQDFVAFANDLFPDNFASIQTFADAVVKLIKGEKTAECMQSLKERQEQDDLTSFKISVQAEEKLLSVLQTLTNLFGGHRTSAEQFFKLLSNGFEAEKISIIPLYNDCVVITNVSKSRANGNKNLMVIGANDGSFPIVKGDTKILADGDIDALKQSGICVTPKIESENKKEKFNVFQLLTAPRKSLYMSYLSGGDTASPCLAAEEISSMFDFDNKLADKLKLSSAVFSIKQAKEKFVEEASKAADGQNGGIYAASNLYYALSGEEDLTRYIYTGEEKPNLTSGKDTLLPKGKTSVTKLESFYRCPYSYFLSNGLKLKDRETGELKVVDTGTILHDVLEKFVKLHLIENAEKLTAAQINGIAKDLTENCLKQQEYARLAKDPKLAFTLQRLKKEAQSVCNAVYEQASNSYFKPVLAELPFGLDGDSAPPLKITANGNEIVLNGKIDRIDAYGDKFILIDYKTGKAKFDETQLYAGQKLQLLTYVKVAQEHLGKNCVGFFYMPVHDKFGKDENDRYFFVGRVLDDGQTVLQIDPSSKDGKSKTLGCRLKKDKTINANSAVGATQQDFDVYLKYTDIMIQNAVKDMADGFIQCRPFGSACGYCDFAGICSYRDLSGNNGEEKSSATKESLAKAVQNV